MDVRVSVTLSASVGTCTSHVGTGFPDPDHTGALPQHPGQGEEGPGSEELGQAPGKCPQQLRLKCFVCNKVCKQQGPPVSQLGTNSSLPSERALFSQLQIMLIRSKQTGMWSQQPNAACCDGFPSPCRPGRRCRGAQHDASRDGRGDPRGCPSKLGSLALCFYLTCRHLGSLARVGAGQVLRGVWEESSGGLWGTHGVWLKR